MLVMGLLFWLLILLFVWIRPLLLLVAGFLIICLVAWLGVVAIVAITSLVTFLIAQL